jgi:hypothetical protein
MFRRLLIGSFAAVALVGGSLVVASAPTAHAQVLACAGWLGGSAACNEGYFNKDTGVPNGTVIVTEQGTLIPSTNQAASWQPRQQPTTSQAGPQPETQPSAQE